MKKLLLTPLLALSANAAEFIIEDVNASKKSSTWIALPYLFSSESMGLTRVGLVFLMVLFSLK